jgi:hypothetical protein
MVRIYDLKKPGVAEESTLDEPDYFYDNQAINL